MQNESLNVKTVKGIFWRFFEKAGAGLVSLAVSIILARILLPEDYATVVLCTVFIAFFGIFFNYGFSQALIKKQDTDDVDYSTVFYVEIFLSAVFYFIIFFLAESIANFFNVKDKQLLVSVIKIMALKIPILAISSVFYVKLSKNLQFKKFFFVSLIGTVISAIVGIIFALKGFGVWALVCQNLTDGVIDAIFVIIFAKWLPKLKFSFKKLKELFLIAYKFLLVGIIDTTYGQLREIVIGRRFTSSQLSYFSHGRKYPRLLVNDLTASISSVLFPALAKLSNDKQLLKEEIRKILSLISFIVFPCLLGFMVIGESFVKVLLTDKWLGCLPFLYIYSVVAIFSPIHSINSQIMKVLNRGNEYLVTEVIKRLIGVIALIVSIQFGVLYIALSSILVTLIIAIFNMFLNKKLINYGIKEQLEDLLPPLLVSFVMCAICVLISFVPISYYLVMVIQIVVGIVVYFILSKVFKIKGFSIFINGISKIKKGK